MKLQNKIYIFSVLFFSFFLFLASASVCSADFFNVYPDEDSYIADWNTFTNYNGAELDFVINGSNQHTIPVLEFPLADDFCSIHSGEGSVITAVDLIFKIHTSGTNTGSAIIWSLVGNPDIDETSITYRNPSYGNVWCDGADNSPLTCLLNELSNQALTDNIDENGWQTWPLDVDNLDIDDDTLQVMMIGDTPLGDYRYYDKEATSEYDPYIKVTCGSSPATTTPIDISDYYVLGDYTVPRNINCYADNQYCDMVFGFSFAAYSRSLASTSPDLPEYPRFNWYWPNVFGQDISSGTIRHYIDIGITQGLALPFTFDTPTSTTNYVLEIYDPGNTTGTTTDFVVGVNLVGSSTSPDIFSSCFGQCDDGILGEIFCGIKKAICWGFVPSQSSYLFISQSGSKIADKFPVSMTFDLLDALKDGLMDTDDRSAVFRVPFREPTVNGSQLIWIDIVDASTTEKTIGKDNAILLRKSIVWLAWLFFAGFVTYIIFFRKKS